MESKEINVLISLIISNKKVKDLTQGALDYVENMEKTEIIKIINYLDSEKIQNDIKTKDTKEEKKREKNRLHILEKIKQSISHNYLDYDIDYFIDLFFPKPIEATEDEEKSNVPVVKKSTTETNQELNTYMFAFPIDNEVLRKNEKESKQENNPFGFDMTVLRNDPKNIALSEMMGIELWLFILNQSGSNTKYWEEYYYGLDKKPHPVYTDQNTIKKVYPIVY